MNLNEGSVIASRKDIVEHGLIVGERITYRNGNVQDLRFTEKRIVEVNDNRIKPSHYRRNGLECFDVIRAAVHKLDPMEAFMIGNVVKYIWRWKEKNGVEDLKKAREYLDRMIKELEGE